MGVILEETVGKLKNRFSTALERISWTLKWIRTGIPRICTMYKYRPVRVSKLQLSPDCSQESYSERNSVNL